MRHLFSETRKVEQANRKNGCYRDPISWRNSEPTKKPVSNNSNSKFKEHSNCRDCGCVLEKKASRIWGICPSCDMR